MGSPGRARGFLGGAKQASPAKKPCARIVFCPIFARKLQIRRKRENRDFTYARAPFPGPQEYPKWSPGGPGAPKMMPGRARNRKRRKNNTLIYFCPCRVDPAAVTSPCSSILGVFWGSPGGARHILGRPRPPENVPGIVPGIPFGLHRAPCHPRARLPGLPRAPQGSPQGSPSLPKPAGLAWPRLAWLACWSCRSRCFIPGSA